jgi:hypothetical protein
MRAAVAAKANVERIMFPSLVLFIVIAIPRLPPS